MKVFKMAEGSADEVSRKIKFGDLDEPPPPPAAKFYEGEKVLCFDRKLLYEAKVSKVQFWGNVKEYVYLIQYKGRNKILDEWIYEKRLLQFSDENIKKQQELAKAHVQNKKAAKEKLSTKGVSQKRPLGGDDTSVSKVPTYGVVVKVPKKDGSVLKVPKSGFGVLKVLEPETSVIQVPKNDEIVFKVPTSSTRSLRARKTR